MFSGSDELKAVRDTTELETAVLGLEQRLAAFTSALREREAAGIEGAATELQQALADAVQRFTHAARLGGVPDPLRRRLGRASAQLASQRDTLSRATAALDRAIDVLLPDAMPHGAAVLYAASGLRDGHGPLGASFTA